MSRKKIKNESEAGRSKSLPKAFTKNIKGTALRNLKWASKFFFGFVLCSLNLSKKSAKVTFLLWFHNFNIHPYNIRRYFENLHICTHADKNALWTRHVSPSSCSLSPATKPTWTKFEGWFHMILRTPLFYPFRKILSPSCQQKRLVTCA